MWPCGVIYLVMGANNLLSKHEKSKKEITELKARIGALLSERVTIEAENKGDQQQSSEELDAAIKNAVAWKNVHDKSSEDYAALKDENEKICTKGYSTKME